MKRILLAFFALLAPGAFVSAVILKVPGYATLNGSVGEAEYTRRPFYSFRAVLYAEKPTSETRFLPPVPKAPYPEDKIVDATEYNLGCFQGGSNVIVGKEDCLALNIYSPQIPTGGPGDKKLPVMYWIHGGSFRAGQALEYIPTRFMEEDIVLVVVQYRLGPLGFLCIETDEVPGNAGIFDQIEGLRWVKKNIAAFGGDPNQVTIAGESAGSASVSLLLLAPQAKGLFHRAIGQSGSVLAEWALDRDGLTPSRRVAELAGCPLEPKAELIKCVRTIDGEKLTAAYALYSHEEQAKGGLGFGASNPVIQRAGKERIIEGDPAEIFKSGKYSTVPIMFGANKREGALVLAITYNSFLEPNNLLENATFLTFDLIPVLLKGLHMRDDTGVLADALTDKYFDEEDLGDFDSMAPGLVDMTGVLFLKSAGYETVRLNSRHNDSYWYSFNFEGRNSLYEYLFAGSWPRIPHKVCHADELIYLYVYPFPSFPPFLNETEKALSLKMVHVWTNFVKYGNPTPDGITLFPGVPKIPKFDRDNPQYVAIDTEWEVKDDYTKTYTVTADELNPDSEQQSAVHRRVPARFRRPVPIDSIYLPQ